MPEAKRRRGRSTLPNYTWTDVIPMTNDEFRSGNQKSRKSPQMTKHLKSRHVSHYTSRLTLNQ